MLDMISSLNIFWTNYQKQQFLHHVNYTFRFQYVQVSGINGIHNDQQGRKESTNNLFQTYFAFVINIQFKKKNAV